MTDDNVRTVYVVTVEQYYANFFYVAGAFETEEAARACADRHSPDGRVYRVREESVIDLPQRLPIGEPGQFIKVKP